MIIIKIYTNELIRIIKSVKKGIDLKCGDELKGIRFKIVGNDLIAFTNNGRIVFTNRTTIIDKDGEIEDGYEFVSPIVSIPNEIEDTVNIAVDYEENTIEYDFGNSKQVMNLYYLNLNLKNIENMFDDSKYVKSEIYFNVESLKKILSGFNKKDVIVFKIKEENEIILVKSESDEKNKRLIMPINRKND